jgi:hypothetical protein
MSKIKLYSSILILLSLCFSSCSMEKRIYSPGYHVEWGNGNGNGNGIFGNKELVSGISSEQIELNKLEVIEQSEKASHMVDNSNEAIDQNIIASVNNESIVLDTKEKNNFSGIQKKDNNYQEVTINSSIKSDFKSGIKTFSENSDQEPKINTLGLISFISAFLPLVFLPLIIVGILPSLLLGAISLRQFKRNPEKYKYKWMATFGVIVGYIGCSLGILLSLVAVLFGEPIWLILGGICFINIIVSTYIITNP